MHEYRLNVLLNAISPNVWYSVIKVGSAGIIDTDKLRSACSDKKRYEDVFTLLCIAHQAISVIGPNLALCPGEG